MRSFLEVQEHLSSLTTFYVLPAPDPPYATPNPFLTPVPAGTLLPSASGLSWHLVASLTSDLSPQHCDSLSSLPTASSPLTQSRSLSLQHIGVAFRRAFKMLTRCSQLQFLSRNVFPGNFQWSLIYKVVDRMLKSVHRFLLIGSHWVFFLLFFFLKKCVYIFWISSGGVCVRSVLNTLRTITHILLPGQSC